MVTLELKECLLVYMAYKEELQELELDEQLMKNNAALVMLRMNGFVVSCRFDAAVEWLNKEEKKKCCCSFNGITDEIGSCCHGLIVGIMKKTGGGL